MFYRLSLPGSRRVLLDHIEFCRKHVPGWNPVSVVGQHMQQAGATPVETMAFTSRLRQSGTRGGDRFHRCASSPVTSQSLSRLAITSFMNASDNLAVSDADLGGFDDAGIDALLSTIAGLLATRARDKEKNRARRMRRLIAQSAGRVVHNRIGDDVSEEMEGLVKAAASGEIGIAEAARRALTIIR